MFGFLFGELCVPVAEDEFTGLDPLLELGFGVCEQQYSSLKGRRSLDLA